MSLVFISSSFQTGALLLSGVRWAPVSPTPLHLHSSCTPASPSFSSSQVKVFIIAYTKFLQRSEILTTWQPTFMQ